MDFLIKIFLACFFWNLVIVISVELIERFSVIGERLQEFAGELVFLVGGVILIFRGGE